MLMKIVASIPAILAFFLPNNNGLGSEAFDLDLQFRYLRHSLLLQVGAGLEFAAGVLLRYKQALPDLRGEGGAIKPLSRG